MPCSCCNKKLTNGMLHKFDSIIGDEYKSCPHCSDTHGSEHVYHAYPTHFTTTEARISPNNPDGWQSYCNECRHPMNKGLPSKVFQNGRLCSSLID